MIRLICFDIDDTLMDFHKGAKIAFMECMKQLKVVCSEENYLLYERINQSLWKALECGQIEKEELKIKRFKDFKEQSGLSFDEKRMSDLYIQKLSEQCFIFDGAMDVVKKCSTIAELAVTTNGIASIQRNRLKKSGLIDYFKYLFISEEMGCSKPQLPYYEEIFRQSGCLPHEIIVIGDSLSADMLGAMRSGCIRVWYNPKHLENNTEITIDYEIDDLNQILNILEELS